MTLLQTLFSFQGRIGRGPFWLCALALTLIDAAVLLVAQDWLRAGYPAGGGRPGASGLVAGGVILLTLALSAWSGLALKVKRLHDRGRSGLYILAAVIPIVGWLWLLWEVGFAPGRKSGARFDNHPEEDEAAPARGAALFDRDDSAGLAAASSYGVLAAAPMAAAAAEPEPAASTAPEPVEAEPEATGNYGVLVDAGPEPKAEVEPAPAAQEPAAEETRSQIAEYLAGSGEAQAPAPEPGEPPVATEEGADPAPSGAREPSAP